MAEIWGRLVMQSRRLIIIKKGHTLIMHFDTTLQFMFDRRDTHYFLTGNNRFYGFVISKHEWLTRMYIFNMF